MVAATLAPPTRLESPTLFTTQLATEVHSAHSFLNFPNSLTLTSVISLSLALYLLPFPLFQTSKPSLSNPTRSLAQSLYLLPTLNLLTHWTFLTFSNWVSSKLNQLAFEFAMTRSSYNKLTRSLSKLPPNLLELALKHSSLSRYLSNSSFDRLTIS